jgi:ParB-like chromosome segregation protein Spo0J
MKILNAVQYDIDGLMLPGDWPKILRDPSVPEMAASIKRMGLLQPVIVRKSDKKLLAGRRRTAAHVALGEDKIWCVMVECADENEAELVRIVENAIREHNPARQKIDVEAMVQRLAAAAPEKRGAVMKAIKEVAQASGVTESAIIKQRQRKRRKAEQEEAQKAKENADPIQSPWFDMSPVFKKNVIQVQAEIDEIDQSFQQAAGKIARLLALPAKDFPIVQSGNLDRLRGEISQLNARIRGSRPEMMCPWCKGQDDAQPLCAPCEGTGYITKHQLHGVPDEFLRADDPVIKLRGETIHLADHSSNIPNAGPRNWTGEEPPAEIPTDDEALSELEAFNNNPFGLEE